MRIDVDPARLDRAMRAVRSIFKSRDHCELQDLANRLAVAGAVEDRTTGVSMIMALSSQGRLLVMSSGANHPLMPDAVLVRLPKTDGDGPAAPSATTPPPPDAADGSSTLTAPSREGVITPMESHSSVPPEKTPDARPAAEVTVPIEKAEEYFTEKPDAGSWYLYTILHRAFNQGKAVMDFHPVSKTEGDWPDKPQTGTLFAEGIVERCGGGLYVCHMLRVSPDRDQHHGIYGRKIWQVVVKGTPVPFGEKPPPRPAPLQEPAMAALSSVPMEPQGVFVDAEGKFDVGAFSRWMFQQQITMKDKEIQSLREQTNGMARELRETYRDMMKDRSSGGLGQARDTITMVKDILSLTGGLSREPTMGELGLAAMNMPWVQESVKDLAETAKKLADRYEPDRFGPEQGDGMSHRSTTQGGAAAPRQYATKLWELTKKKVPTDLIAAVVDTTLKESPGKTPQETIKKMWTLLMTVITVNDAALALDTHVIKGSKQPWEAAQYVMKMGRPEQVEFLKKSSYESLKALADKFSAKAPKTLGPLSQWYAQPTTKSVVEAVLESLRKGAPEEGPKEADFDLTESYNPADGQNDPFGGMDDGQPKEP